MIFGKKAIKDLPIKISYYTERNLPVFIEEIGKILNKSPNEITQNDFEAIDDNSMLKCNNALVCAVASDIYEDISVDYGNASAFYDEVKHIMEYIDNPERAKNSLYGYRPTSNIYDVYELIFGKYHGIDETTILMVYEICYYILTKKAPKRKEQLAAIEAFSSGLEKLDSII